MSGRAAGKPWEQPFYWWGPPWTPPNPISLADLAGQGVIQAPQAASLAAHIRAGRSLVVAALRSGTGKSTLAHALIDDIDPDRNPVYIRGTYEPFDWLAYSQSAQTTLLINEISDHLPVYCWGDCAKQVLFLAGGGYQVIATLHADSPESFLALMRSPGIGASEGEIVALDTVVFLDITASGARYVFDIMKISIDPDSGRSVLRPIDL
jgi:type IV secretory pathway ATPase VirB11/archaellum biosynthesis ATPase